MCLRYQCIWDYILWPRYGGWQHGELKMAVMKNVMLWLRDVNQKGLDLKLLNEALKTVWPTEEAMHLPSSGDVTVCVTILAGLIAKEIKLCQPQLIDHYTSAYDWIETARTLFDEDRDARRVSVDQAADGHGRRCVTLNDNQPIFIGPRQ